MNSPGEQCSTTEALLLSQIIVPSVFTPPPQSRGFGPREHQPPPASSLSLAIRDLYTRRRRPLPFTASAYDGTVPALPVQA
jgi:hypothetical protein